MAQDKTRETQAAMNLATPEGIAKLQQQMAPLKPEGDQLPVEPTRTEESIEGPKPGDRKVKAVKEVPATHYKIFTLAPIYGVVGVPFDLSQKFMDSPNGQPADILKLDVQRPTALTPDIPGWESIVEAIPNQYWSAFVRFMSECMFRRGGNYWTVCGEFIQVPMNAGGMMDLAVFTPRTMGSRMRPWLQEDGTIRFEIESMNDAGQPLFRKLDLFMGKY